MSDEEKKEKKREYMRRYQAEHREKIRAANRDSYRRNRESQLEKKKEWRENNRERLKELNARWYEENKDYARSVRKAYREAHREEIREVIRQWYRDNKDKVRAWRKENREKLRGYHREYMTGCTPEQYQQLLTAQNGLCAICGGEPKKRPLYADHCHASDVVRGLLCGNCNTILGMAKDRIEVLQAAIEYLKRSPTLAADRERGEET